MSHYRKFSLADGDGNTFSLTKDEMFASDPTGFGFSQDISVLRIGNEQDVTYEQTKMSPIGLNVNIDGGNNRTTYYLYSTLVAFLTHSPLYLVYTIPASTSVSKRIRVKTVSLTKTEISEDGTMKCAVSFNPMSLWEDANEVSVSFDPVQYASGYDISNVVSMVNAPITLEFSGGDGVNPTISFQQSNTEYGYIDFVGTYDTITINANELKESIVLSNDGTAEANPYAKQDFTTYATKTGIYKTFVCLKPGTTKVVSSGFSGGTITIKYRNRYLSV